MIGLLSGRGVVFLGGEVGGVGGGLALGMGLGELGWGKSRRARMGDIEGWQGADCHDRKIVDGLGETGVAR